MTAMNGTLFVCGSLVEGMVHYKKIESFVASQERASVKGTAYRLEVGYPVYSVQGDSGIQGRLLTFSPEIVETLFRLLDEFHGYNVTNPSNGVFVRSDLMATVSDGSLVKTFGYSINLEKLPSSAVQIQDGDWEHNFRTQPPLTMTLTERQRTYICKLGSSSGRDIVPINLDLYRELLGKGLIVDKGRRLALTRLGQDVFRYLE